jgi:hypothetical protein
MPKKFFDIIPPEKIEKTEERATRKEKKPVLAKKKRRWFLKGSIVLVLGLILVLIFGFFLFPEAKIEIKPKKSSLTLSDSVTIDLSAESYSFEDKIIPGTIFDDERTLEKDFPSTGKTTAEKKATGTIVVYNEYSTSPRSLVPSRFVSADGKLFWSTESITIPGYTKEGGKIIPGQKEVRVEAAKAGEDYNIGPTTFALPALAGSGLYTTIYAKSSSPMTGGYIGEASSVSEQDLENAESELVKEAKDLSKEALSTRLPLGSILLDETISQQITDESPEAKAGDAVDSFKYKATVKSSAFSFKKEQLDDFINNMIKLKLGENEKVLDNSIKVTYSTKSTDLDSGKLVLEVNVQADAYEDINTEELKKALAGKTKTEAELLLQSLEGVSDFSIKNKPFLRKRLPLNEEELNISLNLD